MFCISNWLSPSLLPSSLTNRPSVLCLFICPYVAARYLLTHSIIQPTTGYFCIVVSVLKSLKLNGRQQSVTLQAFCWMDCFESNQTEGNPSATHQQVTIILSLLIITDSCFHKGQDNRRLPSQKKIVWEPSEKLLAEWGYCVDRTHENPTRHTSWQNLIFGCICPTYLCIERNLNKSPTMCRRERTYSEI